MDLQSSFVADSSGVPTSVIENARWMSYGYQVAPKDAAVRQIKSDFVANAAELRRTEGGRKETYLFEETHSWLDVGLQVLYRARWSPECFQPQTPNIHRALPPNGLDAYFFPGQMHSVQQELGQMCGGPGGGTRALRVEVPGGAIRVHEIFATLVIVIVGGGVQF